MIKKHLPTLILTSLVILIPMVIGLILWDALPEQVPIHWNVAGEVDDYAGKAQAVFVLPGVMLVLHWFCMLVTGADPKRNHIQGKPITLVLWICPVISLLVETMVYATALGYIVSVELWMPLILGAMFVAIGNYLPKCQQNYTVGIRVPWALNDPENWNKTHRFAGIIWVVGGIMVMATALLRVYWIMILALAAMAVAPVVYSYCYYRKSQKDG